MQIKKYITVTAMLLSLQGMAQLNIDQVFKDAEKQTKVLLDELVSVNKNRTEPFTPRTVENGALKAISSRDWTSGFFPGELWYLFEYTRDQQWMDLAKMYTAPLEKEKTNAGTHDMGFKVYCSVGNAYRITKDPHYKEVVIEAAKTLCKRFNKTAGVIRSWDHNRNVWDYPVIIDNMMNLELLFAATELTGDSSFYKIAVTHANTTMKNHFRNDFSTFHVVDYDTTNGTIRQKDTHQGYARESAWARGQAWAVYGYTMAYRFTKDARYLLQAEKAANFMLQHPRLPKDLIPYWDFDAPNIPNEPRDASSAAVLASALYELGGYSKAGKMYRSKADLILTSLTNHYRSPIGENKGFLLIHSTGAKPANSEVDVPICYADYYYLEALLRKQKMKK